MVLAMMILFLGVVDGTHERSCTAVGSLGWWWYNGCNQRCVCEQVVGEFVWNCYRERKEFTCMSSAERSLFIATYKTISTPGHPEYAQYQNLIARHSANFASIHTTQFFLPWHRWFQMEMENLLQNVNCKVTLPWWDTAKNAGNPFTVSPWGTTSDLLGTSGPCVHNGGFASPGWPNNAHGCLSRTLSGTLPTYMQESAVLANTNYVAFSNDLETLIHNVAHIRIGGTMAQTWSPEAPEFFLHHGHIDKLWDDWQKTSLANLNAYSFPTNQLMPVALGATPAQFNDLKSTNVMYVRSSASPLGAGHLFLPTCYLIKLPLPFQFTVDLAVLQTALVHASPNQLRSIPQLGAPVLNSTDEQMLRNMAIQTHDDKFISEVNTKLAVADREVNAANKALLDAGSLRITSNFTSVNKALGFDVVTAVNVLQVPVSCSVRGAVYCPALRRCSSVSQCV